MLRCALEGLDLGGDAYPDGNHEVGCPSVDNSHMKNHGSIHAHFLYLLAINAAWTISLLVIVFVFLGLRL